jgi:hypothetical protein
MGPEAETVRRGPAFDELLALLETATDHQEEWTGTGRTDPRSVSG